MCTGTLSSPQNVERSDYTYTVRDGDECTVYYGFKMFNIHRIQEGDRIVVAEFEGDPELWIVESDEGIENLKQYYEDVWSQQVPILILDQAP